MYEIFELFIVASRIPSVHLQLVDSSCPQILDAFLSCGSCTGLPSSLFGGLILNGRAGYIINLSKGEVWGFQTNKTGLQIIPLSNENPLSSAEAQKDFNFWGGGGGAAVWVKCRHKKHTRVWHLYSSVQQILLMPHQSSALQSRDENQPLPFLKDGKFRYHIRREVTATYTTLVQNGVNFETRKLTLVFLQVVYLSPIKDRNNTIFSVWVHYV